MFSSKIVPVTITSTLRLSRDVDDNKFLDLAISGSADWLVTGDRDLLVVNSVGQTRIVAPATFLDVMSSAAKPLTPRT